MCYVLWSNVKIKENKNYCHFNKCNNVLHYMGSVKKKMYQSHSKYIFRTLEIAKVFFTDTYGLLHEDK